MPCALIWDVENLNLFLMVILLFLMFSHCSEVFQDWRGLQLNNDINFYLSGIWLSGWKESWEGLLIVTDVWTPGALVNFRVKFWIQTIFCSNNFSFIMLNLLFSNFFFFAALVLKMNTQIWLRRKLEMVRFQGKVLIMALLEMMMMMMMMMTKLAMLRMVMIILFVQGEVRREFPNQRGKSNV